MQQHAWLASDWQVNGQRMIEPRRALTISIGVHLYAAMLDEIDDAESRSHCASLLSAEERARCDRFVFERNRREFLYAHALVRLALSSRAPQVAPDQWCFAVGTHGKPTIAGPANAPLQPIAHERCGRVRHRR
jgi:hypothetical protein